MGAKVRSLFADDGDEDPLFGGGGGKRLVSGPDDEGSNRVARPSAAVRNAASAIEGVLTRGEVDGRGRGGGPSRGAGQVEERGGEARGAGMTAVTRRRRSEKFSSTTKTNTVTTVTTRHNLTSNALRPRTVDGTSDVSPCPCASAVCRGSLPFPSVASISAPFATSHRPSPCDRAPPPTAAACLLRVFNLEHLHLVLVEPVPGEYRLRDAPGFHVPALDRQEQRRLVVRVRVLSA